MSTQFIVTENAMRPASTARQCFYCQQPIGLPHGPKCVLVTRRVHVKAVVEFDKDFPAHWDAAALDFYMHENGGIQGLIDAVSQFEGDLDKSIPSPGSAAECTDFTDVSGPRLNEGTRMSNEDKYKAAMLVASFFRLGAIQDGIVALIDNHRISVDRGEKDSPFDSDLNLLVHLSRWML